MSLEEKFKSLQISDPKDHRSYYFIQFENDVQFIFNEISRTKDVAFIKINILKGIIFLEADYYIPLKSVDAFRLNCQELLQKLKTISCVLDVDVNRHHNLTFRLKRDMVYKSVLQEVLKYGKEYGMTRKNKLILVIVNQQESKSFNNLRNALLLEHIISILAVNGIKVFYSDFKSSTDPLSTCSVKLICSDNCSLLDTSEKLVQKIDTSYWKIDSDINDAVCLDAKKYVEHNCLKSTYGNALTNIIIPTDNMHKELHKTAYIKHLIDEHMKCAPDVIIHIASQGQNKNTFKSGILLEMLENYNSKNIYIFSQSVQFKGEVGTVPEDFIEHHREEIEKATAIKYDTYTSENETWKSRVNSLVNAAVKFDFLKTNHNSILNLRSPSSRDGEKNFGIFMQYNFARLSNIFRNFDQKVNEGHYHPLEALEDVQFNLLTLEEEWDLFSYVLLFPKMVQGIVEPLIELNHENGKTKYRLNKVCLMLQELCQNLSLYYSKIRILAGPQSCLQPVMNARLWLLKGIYEVFKNSFTLLNIQGLDQM